MIRTLIHAMRTMSGRSPARTAAISPVVALIALLTGATFAVDLLLPLGIAAGVPYVAPVLAAAWLPNRRYIVPVAALCTLLTMVGVSLSPHGATLLAVIPNRLLVICAVWTIAVMTVQRKNTEEALADREEATRAVLNFTADGLLTLDGDGRIASANSAMERIFGYSDDEVRGLPFSILLDDSEASRFAADPTAFLARAAGEAGLPHQTTGKGKDGTSFPIEMSVADYATSSGIRHAVTVHDITQRRLLERHLLQVGEEQRQLVAHLLHEELGQSLTGLNLISRQLARRLATQDNPEAQEAADLSVLLHEADALALKASDALAPVQGDAGLLEALKRFAGSISVQYDVPFQVESNHPSPNGDLEAAELYRMVQTIVEWTLRQGRPDGFSVTIGEPDDASAISVRLHGDPPDVLDWDAFVRQLEFRARLLDRTIRLEWGKWGRSPSDPPAPPG